MGSSILTAHGRSVIVLVLTFALLGLFPAAGPPPQGEDADPALSSKTGSRGHDLDDVLAGVQRAVARRVVTLVRHVGLKRPVYFSGGVAHNETVRLEIESALEVPFPSTRRPQFTAALGAAILAGE